MQVGPYDCLNGNIIIYHNIITGSDVVVDVCFMVDTFRHVNVQTFSVHFGNKGKRYC